MEEETIITTQHSGTTDAGKHEYESPDNPTGQDICTSYIVDAAFGEQAPAYLDFCLGAQDSTATLNRTRSTKNYGVYDSPNGAITGLYISHAIFDSEDEAPESIGIALRGSTAEAFEEANVTDEDTSEEAGDLLA
jgi:hypothetical protein